MNCNSCGFSERSCVWTVGWQTLHVFCAYLGCFIGLWNSHHSIGRSVIPNFYLLCDLSKGLCYWHPGSGKHNVNGKWDFVHGDKKPCILSFITAHPPKQARGETLLLISTNSSLHISTRMDCLPRVPGSCFWGCYLQSLVQGAATLLIYGTCFSILL